MIDRRGSMGPINCCTASGGRLSTPAAWGGRTWKSVKELCAEPVSCRSSRQPSRLAPNFAQLSSLSRPGPWGGARRPRGVDPRGGRRWRRGGFGASAGDLALTRLMGVIDRDHDETAADQLLDQHGAAVADATQAG